MCFTVKPRFASDHPTVVYAWAGKIRNITCHVKAEPAPTFDWLKNDQLIEDNEAYKIFKTRKESSLQVTKFFKLMLSYFFVVAVSYVVAFADVGKGRGQYWF